MHNNVYKLLKRLIYNTVGCNGKKVIDIIATKKLRHEI